MNCCERGKVVLERPQTHLLLPDLLVNPNNYYFNKFHSNIREYNSSLSFVSLETEVHVTPREGVYTFTIHGRIYHFIGTLHPDDNEVRQFS